VASVAPASVPSVIALLERLEHRNRGAKAGR
jgi:hypothetical protein